MARGAGIAELSRKALSGLGRGAAAGIGLPGTIAGRVVGAFLSGFNTARYQIGRTYHDAARHDPTNTDWRSQLTSADQSILNELDTMLSRSRTAIANDGWAASAQGGFTRYVVGGGITARSAARHPTDPAVGLLRKFNGIRDRLWEERQYTPRLIDAEQTKTGPEKQRLWMSEMFAAGGVFVLHAYRPDPTATRVSLQEIEYEQRDTILEKHDGRAVRGGIEVGDFHEPIAYHLFTAAHPLEDWGSKSTRIPAEGCYHLYRQDRVRQRIGTPWMKQVLSRLRQLAMYEQYTMIQARGRAANVGFIGQENAATAQMPAVVARQLGANQPAPTPEDIEVRVNVAPGLWTVLKPGQKPFMPQPATPDTMYPPFVLEHLKGIAAGTGLDFATVTRWYADGNFSSQRQSKLDLWAEVDWIQDLLFIHKILRADLEEWVTLAVQEGRLPATGFFEDPTGAWRQAYLTTDWQGPPRHSIDEIKDEAAWDMRIKAGRASPQEYCNEHGKSLEQVLSDLAEFRQLAAAQGVGDLIDAWLLGRQSSPNQPKAGMKPDDPTPGDPSADSGRAGEDLAQLVTRQHVLRGLLDEATASAG
ncbi:MAG TPA: phage portal protein, partial [Phycisphaerae bacterium]|nr:phage portal protein [Phycisphaerae bacterium]